MGVRMERGVRRRRMVNWDWVVKGWVLFLIFLGFIRCKCQLLIVKC